MRIFHTKARRHEDFLRLRSQKATASERRTGAIIPQDFPGAIKVDAASIPPKRLPLATATLRDFVSSCEQIAGGADERRYCVAAGGEYEFALTKGVEYSLAVSWDCDVEFSWRDGAGASGAGAVEFEQVGGAARGLDTAARRWRLMWRPFIATDPATVYWNLDDPQPVRIEADIELGGEFSWRWSSGANAARLSNYEGRVTTLTDPRGASSLFVTAANLGYQGVKVVPIVYVERGDNVAHPPASEVAVGVAMPRAMNVKSQAGGYLVPVNVSFRSPEPTNGILKVEVHRLENADSGWLYGSDGGGGEDGGGADGIRIWRLDGRDFFAKTLFYECESNSVSAVGDHVSVEWTPTDVDVDADDVVAAIADFVAVEIEQEPVTTETVTFDDEEYFYNPCCAVVGERTHLKLKMKPALPELAVDWQCIDGVVTFENRERDAQPDSVGEELALTAEQSGGRVRLKVDVYNSLHNTPIFDMDTVAWRDVTIYPCEIVSRDESPRMTNGDIADMLRSVNEIYRQVGMRFSAADLTVVTNNNWNENGLKSNSTLLQICNFQQSTGGLELYFIDSVASQSNGVTAQRVPPGKHCDFGIVVKKGAGATVVAHEIGHACGLGDIYVSRASGSVVLTNEENVITRQSVPLDWGFYSKELTQSGLIDRLLMRGVLLNGGEFQQDIPLGDVFGIRKDGSGTRFDKSLIKVGFRGLFYTPRSL